MSEPTPPTEAPLPLSLARRIDAACERFELAWQAGQRPRIEDYLVAGSQEEQQCLLRELVLLEVHFRRRLGETPLAADYQGRFPGFDAAWLADQDPGRVDAGDRVAAQSAAMPRNTEAIPPLPAQTLEEAGRPAPPAIPGYEVLAELGRGGMGVVYQARQLSLGRDVALKMLRDEWDASPDGLARFRAEAVKLARARHPNIVEVYEVGEQGGRPYFTMEFCPGGSLEDRLDGTPMPAGEAARLVECLARAVHNAHGQGIVHRDLKPGNILFRTEAKGRRTEEELSPQSSVLSTEGVLSPVVSDFGLAKAVDRAVPAGASTVGILGTPSYMAPEQAAGRVREVGPAADVYALGAILYELLTGRPPFKAATVMDTLMQVVSDEPVPPRQLQSKTPRDLETVCLKCLRKEPGRRYGSALDLAEDLRRFRSGEPIVARPVGRVERGAKWVRRNPAVAGLLAAVAVALLLGAGVAALFAVRADWRRLEAEQAREEAEEQEKAAQKEKKTAQEERDRANFLALRLGRARHAFQLDQALRAWERSDVAEAERILSEVAAPFQQTWEQRHLRALCRRKALPLLGHTGYITSVAISADGKRIASGSVDGTVRVWDAEKGQQELILKSNKARVHCVAISADGKRIVSGNNDKTVRVWDATTGRQQLVLKGHTDDITSVAISGDGKRIVSGSGETKGRVWDGATGQLKFILAAKNGISYVAISADGKQIVTASPNDNTVRLWDGTTGKERHTFQGLKFGARYLAISADGKSVVSGDGEGMVRVWDTGTGQMRRFFKGSTVGSCGVANSADGQRVVLSDFHFIRVWDASSGEIFSLGHSGLVTSVAISADGKCIVSGSDDKTVRVWDTTTAQERLVLKGHKVGLTSVAINANGKRIVSRDDQGMVRVWDAVRGREEFVLKGHNGVIWSVAISADGKCIVSGSNAGTVRVWDTTMGKEKLVLKGHHGVVSSVAISADGQRIVSGSWDGTVRVWDAETGQENLVLTGHKGRVTTVAISSTGRWIVSGSADDTVRVWDTTMGKEKLALKGHHYDVLSVAISPDGQRIVSGGMRTVQVWDAATGQVKLLLKEQGRLPGGIFVAISADGKRIVSSSLDKTVRVWDAETGQAMLVLKGQTQHLGPVAISADGERIVSGADDGTVWVWDTVSDPKRLGRPGAGAGH
jgi:WD40 repeat protein/serine/threonine protein kinase